MQGDVIYAAPATGNVLTDTASVQTALAEALAGSQAVELGKGTYIINDTLYQGGDRGGVARGVSLRGQGPMATRLTWAGPPDKPCLFVDHNKFARLESITIGGNGSGTALEIGRSGGPWGGTMSNGLTIADVTIDNFTVGVQAGRVNTAGSELLFRQLNVSRCVKGINAESQNTLNLVFEMLQISNCGAGIYTSTAGSLHVKSGAGSANTMDFDLRTGGAFTIRDFRSENAETFAIIAGTTAYTVGRFDGCIVQQMQPTSTGCLGSGWGGELFITGCALQGPVRVGAQHSPAGSINIQSCGVMDTEPFRTSNPGWSYPYVSFNNKQIDASNNPIAAFPQEYGTVIGGVRTPQ